MHYSLASDEDLSDLGNYLSMLPDLVASIKAGEAADDAPGRPQTSLTPEDEGIRPPDRVSLAALEGDVQAARALEALREQPNQRFSDVLGQTLQWIPAKASRASTQGLKMGNVMELHDLMPSPDAIWVWTTTAPMNSALPPATCRSLAPSTWCSRFGIPPMRHPTPIWRIILGTIFWLIY